MSETTTRRAPHVGRASKGVFLICLCACSPAWPPQQPGDLTNQSIEDLMNVEVTSVSKKEQKLSRTASAVFVITQEDIRRSGATNIPDVLRMVPGVEVAQINANTWAISARGFNAEFSNELLVTVDGRNVYTPTFGGVFWDALDMPLENIERIEVIRGPGGSVWGANAVNGVINIITKKAGETAGAMVTAGGGNVDQGFGTVQYGGAAEGTDYRVWSKFFNQDQFPGTNGQDGGDGWNVLRGGFRTDSTLTAKDGLTFEGGLYSGREGDPTEFLPSITSPGLLNIELGVNVSGGFLQSVWNHAYSARSDSRLMVSYDTYDREDELRETRKTLDLDFQHHFAWGERQDLVWGLDYRYSASHTDGDLFVSFDPADLNTQLFSGFVQDEIAVVPERLYFTVGTKLEHNYYTGFGVLPSVRATYAASERQMFWAAVSRALRTPAATDTLNDQPIGNKPRTLLRSTEKRVGGRLRKFSSGHLDGDLFRGFAVGAGAIERQQRVRRQSGLSFPFCAVRGMAAGGIQGREQSADLLHDRRGPLSRRVGAELEREDRRDAAVAGPALEADAGNSGLPGVVHRNRRKKKHRRGDGERQRQCRADSGRKRALCPRGRDHRVLPGTKQDSLRNQSGGGRKSQAEDQRKAAGPGKNGDWQSERKLKCLFIETLPFSEN